MPRELKGREKMNQMDLSLVHLLQCADEEEDIIFFLFGGVGLNPH
jgi:hypothetical protein